MKIQFLMLKMNINFETCLKMFVFIKVDRGKIDMIIYNYLQISFQSTFIKYEINLTIQVSKWLELIMGWAW